VIAAGAAGGRIGTAFIATYESGAHPLYEQAIVDAYLGDTAISDVFSTQRPLCATSPRHRVLRACVDAVNALPDAQVGEALFGRKSASLRKGSPLSPSATPTGHIEAMAMYASDAAAAVDAIRPAAEVLTWLCEGAEQLLS
jgi:nitronate monooxygenase